MSRARGLAPFPPRHAPLGGPSGPLAAKGQTSPLASPRPGSTCPAAAGTSTPHSLDRTPDVPLGLRPQPGLLGTAPWSPGPRSLAPPSLSRSASPPVGLESRTAHVGRLLGLCAGRVSTRGQVGTFLRPEPPAGPWNLCRLTPTCLPATPVSALPGFTCFAGPWDFCSLLGPGPAVDVWPVRGASGCPPGLSALPVSDPCPPTCPTESSSQHRPAGAGSLRSQGSRAGEAPLGGQSPAGDLCDLG